MKARRIAYSVLAFLLIGYAPATSGTRTLAPVLPEVRKHLDQAASCLQKGDLSSAVAHCDVVLVSDDITVNLAYDNVPANQRSVCERAAKQAFATWQDSLDGTVQFRRVDSGDDANVVIRFRPNVLLKGEAVAGLLTWKRTITDENKVGCRGKFTADMAIRTITPDYEAMPYDAIRHTITHELGHVLGLEDTDNVGELMGPLNVEHPLKGPLPHEIAAVRALREEAAHLKGAAQKLIG